MERNEATIFGIDYDRAISAGKDGWECEDCGCWNNKTIFICLNCEHDEEEK